MESGIEGNDLIDLFAFVGIELRYVCGDVEHGIHFVRIVVADLQRKLMLFGCGSDPQASAATRSAATIVRSTVEAPRKLLDLGLGVIDVFLRNGIVFSFLQFVGLRARVFPRHVVVAGTGAGDEFDLETDGFSHRTSLYALKCRRWRLWRGN
jgi:hypothetical protein